MMVHTTINQEMSKDVAEFYRKRAQFGFKNPPDLSLFGCLTCQKALVHM